MSIEVDCINFEKVKKELKKSPKCIKDYVGALERSNEGWKKLMNDAVRKIKEMAREEKTEWISVKDRLPDFGEHVLVTCKIWGRYIASYQRLEGTNYGNWHDGKRLGVLPPTHWMPLPEPPKTN